MITLPNKHVTLRKISPEKTLYHYTKSNGIQGILRDRAFFATKISPFISPLITVGLGEGSRLIRQITVAPKNHVDLARAGMKMFAEHYGYEVEVCLSRIQLRY